MNAVLYLFALKVGVQGRFPNTEFSAKVTDYDS
jgi:hypothetical protein